jgi:poly(hydroxyalkanoate) depolymerase family esterase
MHPSFQRLMADATQLTRAGDLRAATAAIQAALHGTPPAANDEAGVIDVQAREVQRERDIEAPVAPPRPSHDAGRFIASGYLHSAGSRDYKLYVPPGYEGQALPLVVMLHGCTQDPDDFALGTRMNDAALERGFFVLYPAQAHNANPSRCWNWFKHNHQSRDRGEPALLADMTREVVNRYGIDARRVYVAGLSAGGAMAAILGDAYPDVFAAIGVHSGLPPRSATNAKMAFEAMRCGATAGAEPNAGAAPAIVFHGDQDKTVHPINGRQIVAARAGGTTSEIQRRRSLDGREFTHHAYRDADGRVVAEHWVVHGAGHAWSGGNPRGSYTDSRGPDATEEMLRFFFSQSPA